MGPFHFYTNFYLYFRHVPNGKLRPKKQSWRMTNAVVLKDLRGNLLLSITFSSFSPEGSKEVVSSSKLSDGIAGG